MTELPEVEIIMLGDIIGMINPHTGYYNYGGVVDTDEHYIYFQIPGWDFVDKLPRKDLRYHFGRTWVEIPKRIRDEEDNEEGNQPNRCPCRVCRKITEHYKFPIMIGGYEIMICSECKIMTCTEKEI